MSRLAKFFWFLSILIFLITLLFVYAYMPPNVAVHADPSGLADTFVNRSTFFYASVGLFFLVNIPLYLLRKLLVRNLLQSGATGQMTPARISLGEDLATWLLGFATALNVFFVLSLIYLGVYNNADNLDLSMYGPFVYGGPVLIGILFLVLVYIFLKKRKA